MLSDKLKIVLASTFSLYLKTHNFHWNVEGPYFSQLHELFKTQYDEIHSSIDDIAEKIRMLDTYAPGSYERFQELSIIPSELKIPTSSNMILRLIADHEKMIDLLNETFNVAEQEKNQAIMDFLSGRLDAHAKHRWMLVATSKTGR
jgi:starvation-inducible DNA-binding protein